MSERTYWGLSSFYLLYFAAVGGLIPYFGPYLRSRGFSAAEIGQLLAVLMATKIFAPYLWGALADRTGRRLWIIRAACLGAVCAFVGIDRTQMFWALVFAIAVYGFFWNAALPQFEALTLNSLGKRSDLYPRVRVWGSVGFILAVIGVGAWIEEADIGVMPIAVTACLVGIFVCAWMITESRREPDLPAQRPIAAVLGSKTVFGLLLSCLLMQASHAGYYAFFSIHLGEQGYGTISIGVLWSLGVAAEVALFWVAPRLVSRYSLRKLFLVCFVITAVRWGLIAYAVQFISVLLVAQVMHAVSFGLYHLVAIQLIHRYFTGAHQGRGQALYSALSFGVGGALGSLVMGELWARGGAEWVFPVSGLLSLLAFVVVLAWVERESARGSAKEKPC